MKVAITHDYLIDYGGAEQVLLALHDIYPTAPIFVCIKDKKKMGKFWQKFEGLNIHTSWFQYIPFSSKLISPFRFLLPAIWGSFDLSKFDLIIDSSSWAITRGFKTKKSQVEICYCHTPPRYLYGFDTSRKWNDKWYGKLIDIYAAVVNRFMRIYDFKTSQKVDYFIANSTNTAKRIEKYYNRTSEVIYPPIDINRIINFKPINHQSSITNHYFLTGGRMVAAKNFDLIIKACQKAKVNLKIFGSGILEEELKKIADPQTQFLGKVSDEELIALYKNASAFLVSQKDEDFGMTVVEAQAAGCPVVAYKGGGYLESVIDNRTGLFFDELTVDAIARAIKKFEKKKFNKKDLLDNAKRFSKERFEKEIKEFILNHA